MDLALLGKYVATVCMMYSMFANARNYETCKTIEDDGKADP